jgi:hypothetical protein
MGTLSVGADKGVLGDDLADLQKSVDALPAASAQTSPQTPATRPADIAPPPPTGGMPRSDNGKTGILGDDLADLERSTGALRPPLVGKPPTTGPATQPLGKVTPVAGAGKLLPEQWTLKPGRGEASINGGALTLAAAGNNGSSIATFRTPLAGDFELRVAFTLTPGPAANKAPLSRGLGVRIESANGWKGERLLSIDRTADEKGDLILAAGSDQLEPALEARPKSAGSAIRVQRQGDVFRIATREDSAKEWTDLGKIDAKMSPQLEVWLTAYVTGGDVRAVISQVELQPLSR